MKKVIDYFFETLTVTLTLYIVACFFNLVSKHSKNFRTCVKFCSHFNVL